MTGIFRQKAPGNIVLLFIIGTLTRLPVFAHPHPYVLKDGDGILYTSLIYFLSGFWGNSAAAFAVFAFGINMSIAFLLTNFINADRLMLRPNYLSGMAYILITSFLPAFNFLSSSLVASVFLLGAFVLMFRSHNTKINRNYIFNASLLIGLASLFFVPSVLFIAWAFLALALLRPFRFPEWITLLVGVLTPYYFYAVYLFLNNHFAIPSYFYHISLFPVKVRFNLWQAGALFLWLAPLLTGIYYMQALSGKMMVHVRKGWYLFLWYIIIALLISLCDMENTTENWILLLAPAAAFHGYGYLNAEWKLYPKISFWLAIGFIIASQLYSRLW
ncbi:MAG: hypothetical protein QM640_15135 [Niabella sp.]